MKPTNKKKQPENTLEREYLRVFSANPASSEDTYFGDDSLEQPSPLKSVPTTASPRAEVQNGTSTRDNAELARSIY